MASEIESRLMSAPIVPLIQTDDPDLAVKVAEALAAGGLTVVEVVLRSPDAIDCLRAVVDQVADVIAGAGTVLSQDHAISVVEAGARFIVSPGLDEHVVGIAESNNLPVFPGIATASELQRAWNLGLRAVKFFPAGQAGGVAMLKALASVFQDVQFMPTGGVSASNLADYLELSSVLACGGSWLTPKEAIRNKDFAAITESARNAVAVASSVRGQSG